MTRTGLTGWRREVVIAVAALRTRQPRHVIRHMMETVEMLEDHRKHGILICALERFGGCGGPIAIHVIKVPEDDGTVGLSVTACEWHADTIQVDG